MSCWVEVEVDFDDEETKNFGSRLETAGSSSLYQLQTLATISSVKNAQNNNFSEVLSNPTTGGCTNGSFAAISAGIDVNVFTVDPTLNFLATFALKDPVQSMCFLGNSDILVVGTAQGELTLFSVINKKLIFSQLVYADSNVKLKEVSCSVDQNTGNVLLFICTTGTNLIVVRLPKLTFFETALKKFDQSMLKKLQSSVTRVLVDYTRFHNSVKCVSATIDGGILISGVGKYSLTQWEATETTFVCTSGAFACEGDDGFKKMYVTSNGLYLIASDVKGSLNLWDLWTFICIDKLYYAETDTLVDFLLLESNTNGHGVEDYRLYLLLENHLTSSRSAEIRNLADLTLIYSVAINNCSSLVKCPMNQDALYLVEGVSIDENKSQIVDQLRLRCITEAQPEVKLGRLLSRGKFREAELLARTFGLSMEIVFKTEANQLISNLSQSEDPETVFLQITKCLDQIKDQIAVVSVCCSAIFPDFQLTTRLITYAKSRLTEYRESSPELQKVSIRLLKYQFKMTTFKLCYGASHFSLDSWEQFNRTVPSSLMKSFLAAGRLGDAITVWARCTEEILADLNESNVLTFLSMIPDEITSDLLAPWLQTEVFPYLIVTFPTAVESLASWVDQRARNMELSEVKGWPANSLMFAGILPKVLDSIENGPLCQTPAQIATVTHHLSAVLGSGYRPTSALRRLNLLIEQLKSLGRMHNTYNCRLSLAAFTAETCETLCYRILDRVQAIELIASGIEQFAKPYMKENNLPVDQTLYQYVKDIIQQSKKVSKNYVGDSVWEARALAVVSCINQMDFKLRSVLAIVEKANIPWSSGVAHMVDNFSKVNNPIVAEIEKTRLFVDIKLVLSKYNLTGFNVSRNLASVDILVKLILSKGRSDALKDALTVGTFFKRLSEVDVYLMQFRIWLGLGRVSDVLKTIGQMSKVSQKSECCRRLLLFCKASGDLSWEATELDALQRRYHILSSAERIRATLEELNGDSLEWEELSDRLWALASLQLEFGELVKLSELEDPTFCQLLLLKYVNDYQSDKTPETFLSPVRSLVTDRHKLSTQLTWSKISRLCDLLKIEKTDLLEHLVITATESHSIEKAIGFCMELASCANATVAEAVRNAVCRFVNLIGNPPISVLCSDLLKLSDSTVKLMASAVSHCDTEVLQSFSETSELAWLAVSTVKQIAGHSISERNGIGNSNCFYKDVGLLLPLEKVLSIVYSATSDLMKVNQPVSSQSMVDNMKTNGHLLLATQWSSVLGGMASAEDLREELQEKLVEKIVLSTSNDLELLFAHISCIPVDRVFSFLYELRNKVGSNYKALTSLTYCASGVATLHGNDMLLELLQKAKTAALWGYQLSSLNVDCQAAIDGSPEDQLALVRQFQKIPDLSVEFLRRYCDDFQLDFDEAVLLLMESFLLSLVEEDASLIGEKPTLGRLKRILDSALPRRWNRLNACRFLDILKKLDPYNYDGIQFILSRLEVPDIQHYFEIFRFLKTYERFQKVGPIEKQMFMEFSQTDSLYCGSIQMPIEAEKRLPFHPFIFNPSKCWEILKSELCLNNIGIWLSQAQMIQIQPEKILLQTITNLMPEISAVSESDSSSATGLRMVERIAQILDNFPNHQVAVMCASTLAKNLSSGLMRLEATKIMLRLTERRIAMGPKGSKVDDEYESAKKAYVQFRQICSCFETEAILKDHQFAQPHFLEFQSNPMKLIFALFDRFDTIGNWNQKQLENLKDTIMKICAAHSLDIIEVLSLLKEKYLPIDSSKMYSSSYSVVDETRLVDKTQANLVQLDSKDSEKQLLRKAVLLLSYGKLTQATILQLMSTIDNETNQVELRLRALKVLFAICPTEQLAMATGTTVEVLKCRLRDLQYLWKLERLKILQSELAFANSNKEGLLKGFWSVSRNRSEGADFIASLIQDYQIDCGDLLDELFQTLNARDLVAMCISISFYVRRTDSLWLNRNLPRHWAKIVCSLLGECGSQADIERIETCLGAILMLLRCPMADEELIRSVGEYCQMIRLKSLAEVIKLLQPTAYFLAEESLQDDFGAQRVVMGSFPLYCRRVSKS